MGFDGRRVPQLGNGGGRAGGADGIREVFCTLLGLLEKADNKNVRRGQCGEATFYLRGQGTRLRLGRCQADRLETKQIRNPGVLIRGCGSGQLRIRLKTNRFCKVKKLNARLN